MRILHISTVCSGGGAANAMRELHESLVESGVPSQILFLDGRESPTDVRFPRDGTRDAVSRIVSNLLVWEKRSSVSNSHFSLDFQGYDLTGVPEVRDADIIHLHWVAGFISSESIAGLIRMGKRIVWTMHDIRPVSGGCHFPAGCDRYQIGCPECPQLTEDPCAITRNSVERARPIFSPDLTLIAPSEWMRLVAEQSSLGSRCRIEHIPYALNTVRFCPEDPAASRKRLGLQESANYVLVVADSFGEKRKGLDDLREILRRAAGSEGGREAIESGAWRLAVAGKGDNPFGELGWVVDELGYVDRESMRYVYSAAQVLLFGAAEDNLPNVLLESSGCGTPVIAFRTGGVTDIITDGVNGWLIEPGDLGQAAEDLVRTLAGPSSNESVQRARDAVVARFSIDAQRDAHIALYSETIDSERKYAGEIVLKSGFEGGLKDFLIQDLARRNADTRAEFDAVSSARLTYIQQLETACAERLAGMETLRLENERLNADLRNVQNQLDRANAQPLRHALRAIGRGRK